MMDLPNSLKQWPEHSHLEAKHSISFLRLQHQLGLLGLSLLNAKAGFDPNQPRVPSGSADGGRWSGGGAGSSERPLSSYPREPDLGIAEESYGLDALMGIVAAPVASAMELGDAIAALGRMSRLAWENLVGEEGIFSARNNLPPRPEGIPEDWTQEASDDGLGYKYIKPGGKKGTYVRTSRGDPEGSSKYRQKPYIKWQKNGRSLDKNGQLVDDDSEAAHIPVKDFKFYLDFLE